MKVAIVAILALAVSPALSYADTAFQIQGFALPSGYLSFENPSINQSDQVAVTAYSSVLDNVNFQFEGTPFLWSQGQLTPLSLTGSVWGSTSGINSAGVVVGYTADSAGSYHPVMWAGGSVTYLSQGGMPQGMALSINDSNQISGMIFPPSNNFPSGSQAVVWNGGTLTNLGNFGSASASAFAINNRSQVVVTTSDGVLFYDQGQTTPMVVSGLTTSNVYAANNAGQLIGIKDLDTGYVWQNGTGTLLANLPGAANVTPWAINDDGDVVETTYLDASDQDQVATLWRAGAVYDLNSLIDPNSGWVLDSATGITDDGTIVGIGAYQDQQEVFILTPDADGQFAASSIPEPASLSLLTIGSLLLLKRKSK